MSIAALVAADDDDTAASAGSSVQVSLSEFAITPSSVTASAGGSLHVTNDGTATHNLRVVDTDLITPDLAAGETGELDISSLEPGGYELLCEISGHADAGMTAHAHRHRGRRHRRGAARRRRARRATARWTTTR